MTDEVANSTVSTTGEVVIVVEDACSNSVICLLGPNIAQSPAGRSDVLQLVTLAMNVIPTVRWH